MLFLFLTLLEQTQFTSFLFFYLLTVAMPQSVLLLAVLLLSLYFFQYSVSLALVFNISVSFVTGFNCFCVSSGNFPT